ncbi:hypothetical protein MNBD_GAMMA01-2200 [hydrothermal vent metagenome]|uniref:Uncharacterized protein n=1 Tax=hydrothermal vent metagenome TaxID=652676 RepID=A0A3B0VWC9_9ZZZZ
MKKNTMIPIVLVAVVLVATVFFLSTNKGNKKEVVSVATQEITAPKDVDKNKTNNQKPAKLYQPIPVEPMSDYIKQLNTRMAQDLGLYRGSKSAEVLDLYRKSKENTDNVIIKIEEYFDDIAQYQIQTGRLMISCGDLNKKLHIQRQAIHQESTKLTEMFFNKYYFYQGLYDSGVCKMMGTKKDPFWTLLKLARQGDEIAQLLLLQNIEYASYEYRKTVDIKKHPIEYMQLRDEAIGYLHKLASKRVYQAAERLGRLYSGRGWPVVPKNPLLAYYYYYLANKTNSFERKPFEENLDQFYRVLTDKQKEIVDRMTDNL